MSSICDQKVYLYLVDLKQFEFDEAQLRDILNDKETERFEKFKNDARKKQFATARWLIKIVLRDKFEIPLNHQYQLHDYRNWLCHEINRQFTVSISHSKNIVAVLVTPIRVNIGVDVEFHKVRDYIGLADSFADEKEMSSLHQSANKCTDFYKLWTAKEAFYKATNMTSLSSNNMQFHFWSIKQNTYSLSVCCQTDLPISIQEVDNAV